MIAYPKQSNAPEGFSSNAVRQGEMDYIALPNVARQRLLEAGLDDLWTRPCQLISHQHRLMHHAENQTEITSSDLFYGHFYVLRWLQ